MVYSSENRHRLQYKPATLITKAATDNEQLTDSRPAKTDPQDKSHECRTDKMSFRFFVVRNHRLRPGFSGLLDRHVHSRHASRLVLAAC